MEFSTKIIHWYHKNKRELPWRQDVNPYFIWLSEVILQQTRVSQGLPYYVKFTNNYPTVRDLANAKEERVLKDWQGLGYYSRARNLHAAAKSIVKRHQGIFPNNYKEIIDLEGIGPYTAAAIASIAFGLPYPVIDGNVQRVISRIFGIKLPVNSPQGKKEIELVLEKIFDTRRPGDFNQAIMEFGALHCKPQQPLCSDCPFALECYALNKGLTKELPLKEKKVKVKARYFLYIVPQIGDYEFIMQRKKDDIWKNLFEFPLVELDEPSIFTNESGIKDLIKTHKVSGSISHISKEYKHVLTHRIIYARFVTVKVNKTFKPLKGWVKKEVSNHDQFAVPVLMQRFFEDREI